MATNSTGFSLTMGDEPNIVKSLFATIYGLPGVSKTSVSFTAPGKVLLFDFDRGSHRAVRPADAMVAKVDNYGAWFAHVMGEQFQIFVENNNVKTIVIDTVGALLDDFATPWLIGKSPKNGSGTGSLSMAGWGELGTHFNQLKSRFQSLGVHVLCICHAKETGNSGTERFDLAVKGGSSDLIHRTSDLIGFLKLDGRQRVLTFFPTSINIGKNSGNISDRAVPDADEVNFPYFMAEVFRETIEAMERGSTAQIEARKAQTEWLAAVAAIKDAKGANFQKNGIAELKGTLASIVRAAFSARVKELGLVWDGDAKVYADPATETEALVPEKETDPLDVDYLPMQP